MAIDDRTSNLSIPKPNQDNTLLEDVARLRAALDAIDAAIVARETSANKGQPNGYAGLDSSGHVPASQLPSFVDDVLEFASLAGFPATGEAGKIYVALDTGKTYRWGGSAYAEISASPGSTDAVPEGSVNLYFTSARALAAVPVATASTAGRVKPGTGLSVAVDGTLNATGGENSFDDLVLAVASAGQTSFTVSGGYTAGAIDVHLNGVKLNGGGDDYTATNGTSITLSVGANTGDLLVLRRWATFEVANAVTLTGGQTLTNKTIDGNLNNLINVGPAEVRTPTNVSPATGATNIDATPELTGSSFQSLYGVAMTAAQWQVSTVSNFASTVVSTGDVAGTSVSYTVSSGVLSVSTLYYWRVRYKDSNGVYSAWSTPTSFTTASAFTSYIATPTATPAAFGDALEGGFYAGMIWNEVVQSSSSKTLATGTQTFTVPDMTSTPLVYAGQTLEVRSRANPANKFIGTVTGASGTTLTLNVASIGGSGTFSDWSVMSRYRVVVAPKASGENATIAWKNANTAGPSATGTLTEGFKATEAMRLADTSTVYPAAHWARNLSINGRTDWYVPAGDELELLWRNLKPVTNNNYVTADRSSAPTPNYTNLGSVGTGGSTSHGVNNNSSPTGVAYTASNPGQVAATAFRTGGAEVFEFGSARYWSSTEFSASSAWSQGWDTSIPGSQYNSAKTNTFRVRAIRRSII